MQEFIIPDDGFVVKTVDGRPVLELSVNNEGNVVRLFSAEGEPQLAVGTHLDTGLVIVGDPQTSGIAISVSRDASEISIINSGKSITLALDASHSEMRFLNADGAVTNKIYVDEDGG